MFNRIRVSFLSAVVIAMCLSFVGCGSNETIMPSGQFTDEQIEAIKAEDANIEDEESQGSMKR